MTKKPPPLFSLSWREERKKGIVEKVVYDAREGRRRKRRLFCTLISLRYLHNFFQREKERYQCSPQKLFLLGGRKKKISRGKKLVYPLIA